MAPELSPMRLAIYRKRTPIRTAALVAAAALVGISAVNGRAQGVRGVTRQTVTLPPTFLLPPAPVATQRVVIVRIEPPLDPDKAAEVRSAREARVLEFQRRRAAAGAPTAQYDLGMRYLKGDGVEQNAALARHWLELSAKGGNKQAARTLESLRQQTDE